MADHEDSFDNACYWTQPSLRGTSIAIWRPENPLLGAYNVYVWHGRIPGVRAASNAQYTVTTRCEKQTFVVDQNENIGH